jgi:hypothetical protein
MSKMMRISDDISKQIEDLIELTGQSRQKILKIALQNLAKQLFFKKSSEQYHTLRKDKKEWESYIEEMKEWDITLQDGLEDE